MFFLCCLEDHEDVSLVLHVTMKNVTKNEGNREESRTQGQRKNETL